MNQHLFAAILASQDLPKNTEAASHHLPRDTIATAFQFIEFLHMGHKYARELLTGELLQTAQAITATNFRPPQNADIISKARDTRVAKAVESPRYPAGWAVDKPALCEAIAAFKNSTKAYRNTQVFHNFEWRIPTSPLSELHSPALDSTPDRAHPPHNPSAPRKEPSRSASVDSIPFRIKESSNYRRPSAVAESPSTHNNSNSSPVEKIQRVPPSIEQRPPTEPTSNMASNQLNAALLEQIEAMINRAITACMATPQPSSQPEQGRDVNWTNTRWYAADLGFFDPGYEGKTVATGDPMEHAGKDTIFRDVHLFMERIRDIAAVKRDEVVRQNLSMCLKGVALAWYTSELTMDQKQLLKLGQGIEQWEQKLVARFKERPNKAMATMVRERYTIADARNKREPREYAGIIMRAAKSAKLGGTGHIIMLIYNGLDIEFQRDITMPTLATTLEVFLQELDDHKDIWWGLASQASRPFGRLSSSPYYATAYSRGNSSNPYYNRGQSRFSNQLNTYSGKDTQYQGPSKGNPFRLMQNEADTEQPNAKQVEGPKPRLMITAGPANGSDLPPRTTNYNDGTYASNPFRPNNNYQAGRWNTRGRQNGSWRQRDRPQGTYFAESSQHTSDQHEQEPLDETPQSLDEHYASPDEPPTEQPDDNNGEYHHEEYGYYVGITVRQTRRAQCRNCKADFTSNNKLHAHIRVCQHRKRTTNAVSRDSPLIIKSDATTVKSKGLAFQSWHFATFTAKLAVDGTEHELCGDTGCIMSLINRAFLLEEAPQLKIERSGSNVTVRGIGSHTHECNKYVVITVYIPGIVNDSPAIASITHQLHVVDQLQAKILVGMDILGPEQAVLDIRQRQLTLPRCKNLQARLTVTPKLSRTTGKIVLAKELVTVPPNSVTPVPIQLKKKAYLPPNQDFLFQPVPQGLNLGQQGGPRAHIVDSNFAFVEVQNATDRPVVIPRRARLRSVTDYEEEGCYAIGTHEAYLAAGAAPTGQQITAEADQVGMTEKYPIGFTAYGTQSTRDWLFATAAAYPIWHKTGGFIHVLESEWMPIPLRPDAAPTGAKVYQLGPEDKRLIDEMFNLLHQQGKME